MKQRLPAIFINGALAIAALVTIFPLLWMVSVSFMHPGEASAFPPPNIFSASLRTTKILKHRVRS